MKQNYPVLVASLRGLSIAVIAAILVVPSGTAGAAEDPPLAGIEITYKLDPRLTRGIYMGERWVSPRVYTCVGTRASCTFEAKVRGVDRRGKRVTVEPDWTPGDPDFVDVSPARGDLVAITVKGEGETTLEVTSEEVTRTLSIKAGYRGGAIQAEISETP